MLTVTAPANGASSTAKVPMPSTSAEPRYIPVAALGQKRSFVSRRQSSQTIAAASSVPSTDGRRTANRFSPKTFMLKAMSW